MLGGALLVVGKFVPVGLTLLGPVVVNIVLFHLFMDRTNIATGVVVLALWLFLVGRWRAAFAGIFRA